MTPAVTYQDVADERLAADMAAAADLFDADFYADAYPTVAARTDDLLRHFCVHGWRELRKPNRDFDVWWYWATHLDPGSEDVNPLVHYARTGLAQGLSTRPASVVPRITAGLAADGTIRRACLFAGFDAEGVIDEALMTYLRDLARFADVFVLFDNYLPGSELDRLRSVATEAWAIRHGAYDIGSYSMLARDLVGWDRLSTYDEVLFVNDSCYLLRPLDEVFARMEAESCAWWGLQATKGIAMTRDAASNQFTEPIPLDTVREELLGSYEEDPVYDFLVASYFLAFRRPVLEDPVFRKVIDAVITQQSKLAVIQKYEIGITHLLVGRGYQFSTFIPALYPFHPVFTEWAFELIAQGFPLLKKYFLYQNHYDTPGLIEWRQRITSLVPDAPLDVFEQNLLRTSPSDRLHRSFAIARADDGTIVVPEVLAGPAFVKADRTATKHPDWWVFAVDADTHALPENSRAVFDRIADDPEITKVILSRSRSVALAGTNVIVEPLLSPEGQAHLLGAGVVFVTDRPNQALGVSARRDLHHVIAVRRGLSLLKRGENAAPQNHPGYVPRPADEPLKMLHRAPRPSVTAVLTASDVDHVAEISAQFPARYADGWRTGIPAHDHLLAEELPADLAEQERLLHQELGGRRLLLLTPLGAHKRWVFNAAEVRHLASWARENDGVIGVREPLGDLERPWSAAFGDLALDVSPTRFPSTATVLRSAALLLTDYEGSALDFTLTGRPVVSFAPDLDLVADRLLYDVDHMFPGPVCRDFGSLADVLPTLVNASGTHDRQYERARDLMVDHRDGRNSVRVVDRLRALLEA